MHIYVGVLFICLVNICAGHPHNFTWDYTGQGSHWPMEFKTCGGKGQSPIDIKDPECDKALNNSIILTNYDNAGSSKFKFENNGHSVVLRAASTGGKAMLGSLGTFNFHQLHFHWGKNDTRGSEHTFMGKAFPGEIHLVHINAKYTSFHEAQSEKDGLALFAFFIKVGEEENPAFNFLNFTTYDLIDTGTHVNVTQFAINGLLPKNQSVFYRYHGSMTAPTCEESVIWTVFDQPIYLSENQFAEFRRLKDEKGATFVDNFRVIQNLNDRKITYWSDERCVDIGGTKALGASIFSVLLPLLLFTLA